MQDYTVILSADPDQHAWTAFCPAMPGAVPEAETREDALYAMAPVMAGWIEVAVADGHGPLTESPGLVAGAVAEALEDRAAEGWDMTVETVAVRPLTLAPA